MSWRSLAAHHYACIFLYEIFLVCIFRFANVCEWFFPLIFEEGFPFLIAVNEFVWQRFRLEIISLFPTCLKTLSTLKLPCINLPIMVSVGNAFILILGMVFFPQLLELYLARTTCLESGLPLLLCSLEILMPPPINIT